MINSLISSLIQLRVSDLHIVASKAPPPVHRLPSFQFLFQTRFSFQAHIFLQIAIVQNMKIPADEHVTALNSATGKKRLFHIGMNTVYSTKFRSNYVLKKSFKIDNEKYNPIDTPTNTINIHTNLTIDTSQAPNSQESSEGTSTRSTTATTDNEPATKKSKQAHNNTESDN
ncbi:uncharacterized protein [Miscanthus floridulus]|uniref:uncharacterized protein isoform X2 n=1 Tax=Miscanthus floridulus TaxID=154761 RepID=UPI003457A846